MRRERRCVRHWLPGEATAPAVAPPPAASAAGTECRARRQRGPSRGLRNWSVDAAGLVLARGGWDDDSAPLGGCRALFSASAAGERGPCEERGPRGAAKQNRQWVQARLDSRLQRPRLSVACHLPADRDPSSPNAPIPSAGHSSFLTPSALVGVVTRRQSRCRSSGAGFCWPDRDAAFCSGSSPRCERGSSLTWSLPISQPKRLG